MPVSTISAAVRPRRRASRTTSSTRRERLGPRAIVVAQNVQCSSQPSWILSQARAPRSKRRSGPSTTGAGRPSARSTPWASAPPTTASTSASPAIEPSSSAAAHPMTTVRSPGRSRARRRTRPRILASLTCVTVHELTTAASAARGSATTRAPAPSSACRTTSVSYWFALHPKVWRYTRITVGSACRRTRSRPARSCLRRRAPPAPPRVPGSPARPRSGTPSRPRNRVPAAVRRTD